MWDELAKECRPILVYGMGNGADKLIRRLAEYDVDISDVFASDGFVRGHSFHGIRVKSFSEVKELYNDFVIVLSFGTKREQVLDMLSAMDREYDMYVPDMPVANEEEYFDREFYNTHYDEIKKAYDRLSDERSKKAFSSILHYKISGRMKYLEEGYDSDEEIYSLISPLAPKSVIDGGAYDGDSLIEMRKYLPSILRAIAVEPDCKTFKKLLKNTSFLDGFDIKLYNAALWSSSGVGRFSASANRNSTVVATASYEYKEDAVELVSVDGIADGAVDYIKYDVEGAEAIAISGSLSVISRYSPALRIAIYHRSCDVFSIINYMSDRFSDYDYYIRRKRCLPAWEIDLIMIPRRIQNEK